jgi:hypothetical protein
MASGTGNVTLDFGAAPGTNIATATVTGQTTISATSGVEAYLMGIDTTATHNAVEHSLVPINLSCISITAGTGFTIQGASEWRLTGTFKVRWVWAD